MPADTEPAKQKPNLLDRVEATLETWASEPRILLDTAVTVVSALVAYHLSNDIALSTAVGMGAGILIPPAARHIDNQNAAGSTPNGHYATEVDERSFITKLAHAFKTGKRDIDQSDTVPVERKPRKD